MNECILTLGACLAGCFLGVCTGLAPGIHVNTLIPFLVLLPVRGHVGAVVVFSLAVTHTVIDFVPSTLFGIPNENTALSVLPAHRLLLSGRGYEALTLTVVGSLGALLLSCALVLPLVHVIPFLCETVQPWLKYILLALVGMMVLSEKSPKSMLLACGVFLLSGVYGYIILSNALVSRDLVLFPVFSGLFGLSTLVLSTKTTKNLPSQSDDSRIHLKGSELLLSITKGGLAGIVVSLFPGIGPAHATAALSVRSSPRQFLVASAGVSTANTVFALVTLYTIGKARSGVVLALQDMVEVDTRTLATLLACSLVAAGVASLIALSMGRKFLSVLPTIGYRKVTITTCGFLILMVGITTGVTGLFILSVGCFIGILPPLLGVRRSHCMGVLILPIFLIIG